MWKRLNVCFSEKNALPKTYPYIWTTKLLMLFLILTFLWLFIDENLSRKTHITMVTNKLSKISGVLHRLKYIYPQHVLVAIYKSLFVPLLNYGSLLWGHNFDTVSKL